MNAPAITVLVDQRLGWLIRCPEFNEKPELEAWDEFQAGRWIDHIFKTLPNALVNMVHGRFDDDWRPIHANDNGGSA